MSTAPRRIRTLWLVETSREMVADGGDGARSYSSIAGSEAMELDSSSASLKGLDSDFQHVLPNEKHPPHDTAMHSRGWR